MNTEKILESARKNKNKGREYENIAFTRSGLWGAFAALLIGTCLLLFEYFINGSLNVGLIAVGITALGIQSLYEGIKVKRVYLIITGVIQTLIALFAILVFVGQVVLP